MLLWCCPHKEKLPHFGNLPHQLPLHEKDHTSNTPAPHKLYLILSRPTRLGIFEYRNSSMEATKSNSQSLNCFMNQTSQSFCLPRYCIPSMKLWKCLGQLPKSKIAFVSLYIHSLCTKVAVFYTTLDYFLNKVYLPIKKTYQRVKGQIQQPKLHMFSIPHLKTDVAIKSTLHLLTREPQYSSFILI